MNEAPLYIGKDIVAKYIDRKWDVLVPLMEETLKTFSEKKVIQPQRPVFPIEKHKGEFTVMPAYDQETDNLGTKVITVYPENKNRGMPVVQATILIYDATNGKLKAIIDGEQITAVRTAAVSMVATKYLGPKNPKKFTILGAGLQARGHYQAMKYIYNFQAVSLWTRSKENGEKFAEEIRKDGIDCYLFSTIQDAVKDADIITTVTRATAPFLKKEWIKDGAHINAIGALDPEYQELDKDLLLSSIVYVDSVEATSKESGDIIRSGAEIYAEIGDVALGLKDAFPDKTTIFKSVGLAVEDVATADFIYKSYCKEQKFML